MRLRRNDKIIATCVALVSICVALTPLLYVYFVPKTGALIYKKEGEGIDLSGTTSQYGLAGSEGEEIEAKINFGFVFDSWSDGGKEAKRKDRFAEGANTFIAKANYDTPDLPFINLRKEGEFTIGTMEEKKNVRGSHSNYKSFENYKQKYQQDFYVKLNEAAMPLAEYSSWVLKSAYFDHSTMRTILGQMCLDILKSKSTEWTFLNVYVDGTYNGVYVAIPAADSANISNLQAAYIENNIPENEGDFRANGRTVTLVQNNVSKEVAQETYTRKSEALIKADYKSAEKEVDIESFANTAAIASVLKNSSLYEQDFYTYLGSNEKLYSYTQLCPTELSCGFWEWLDYQPEGEVAYSSWISHLMRFNEFQEIVKGKVAVLINELSKTFNRAIQNCETISYSLSNNDVKWNLNPRFGTPKEYRTLSTRKQYVEQLEAWLSKRLEWLKANQN